MAVPRKEKAYEKYAWIILLALQVFGLIFILGDSNPARTPVWFYLIAALYVAGIAVTLRPFRKGRRWAWYFQWYVPALWISEAVIAFSPAINAAVFPGQSIGPYFYEFTTFLIILSFLGLFLPYRKFFPKKPVIGAASA